MSNLNSAKQLSSDTCIAQEKCCEARREANSLATELAGLKKEFETAKEQLSLLNSVLNSLKRAARQNDVDKAALTAAQIKITELEVQLDGQAEAAELVRSQQNKLMRYSELEKQLELLTQEHSKLRESTSNSLYLEGVVEDLRRKVNALSEKEREVKSLKIEVGLAEGKMEEWRSIATTTLGQPEPTPSSLSRYLKTLHSEHLLAASHASHLQAKIKSMEESQESGQAESKALIAQIAKLRTELEGCNTTIRRLKKQNTLVTWERNDLRSLVDSCQKEMSMNCVLGLDSRIDALEKLVDGYRKCIDHLEQNPDLINPGCGAEEDVEGKLRALSKERDELKLRVEQLEGEMEHRALRGDFNLRDTKIMHFKSNPTAEAEDKRNGELASCQAEILKLRERVKLLQEGQTVEVELTQVVESKLSHAASKQIDELEEKVKSQEVQNQRLREAFKAKGHEFREAIFSLLGYKVDSLPNKVYRLSSLYAESPEHHLIFKMSSNGNMELLETEFSVTLSDLIELHLSQHHSIPVFLSSITVDLFQRQTHSFHSFNSQY